MVKQAKLLLNDKWIYFNVKIKVYTNIITFLDENNISFIKNQFIDFNKVPLQLHGYGKSSNLIEYLANNKYNNGAIMSFLAYFIDSLFFSYLDGSKIKITIIKNNDWTISKIKLIYQSIILLTVDNTLITADNTVLTVDKTVYSI